MTRTNLCEPTSWRKSSYSGGTGDNCIEVRDGVPGVVPVRDSKDPAMGTLFIQGAAWTAFLGMAKAEPTV